jgi:hypothetical protein
MRQRYTVYIVIAFFCFLCGCETVGAFGTGRIKSSDVAYITHAGTLGKTTTPVNIDSPAADENLDVPPTPVVRKGKSLPGISKTDGWLEENLW